MKELKSTPPATKPQMIPAPFDGDVLSESQGLSVDTDAELQAALRLSMESAKPKDPTPESQDEDLQHALRLSMLEADGLATTPLSAPEPKSPAPDESEDEEFQRALRMSLEDTERNPRKRSLDEPVVEARLEKKLTSSLSNAFQEDDLSWMDMDDSPDINADCWSPLPSPKRKETEHPEPEPEKNKRQKTIDFLPSPTPDHGICPLCGQEMHIDELIVHAETCEGAVGVLTN